MLFVAKEGASKGFISAFSCKKLLAAAGNRVDEPSIPHREHANQVRRNKQRLLEQIQSHRFQDWDRDQDPETHCYDTEWPSQLQFFSPDLDSRNHKPTGLLSQKLIATFCGF